MTRFFLTLSGRINEGFRSPLDYFSAGCRDVAVEEDVRSFAVQEGEQTRRF